MKEIYLDNSATTRAYDSVGELVRKVMCEDYGNPSSRHTKGVEAEQYIKEARLWQRSGRCRKKRYSLPRVGQRATTLR